MKKTKTKKQTVRVISAEPPDDSTVESESCDSSNADMENSVFVSLDDGQQSKEEYEEEMNKVDDEVEINFMGDE
eukprot:3120355-Ditylum_brightwellii.AAC.1